MALATPALDSCRDLYVHSATAALQIKETALHNLHEVWYYLSTFFFPNQWARLLHLKLPDNKHKEKLGLAHVKTTAIFSPPF